jgi:hypothetical protein
VVLNQLPAGCTKRPQVRARRVEDRSRLRIADAHVTIEVEHPEIPIGVLEDRRPVVAVAEHELDGACGVRRRDPEAPAAGHRFGPGWLSDEERFLRARIARSLIDLLERVDLRSRQTIGRVRPLADERGRIEPAGTRILDQAIGHAVEAIARGHDGSLDDRELCRRDGALRRRQERAFVPDERGEQA